MIDRIEPEIFALFPQFFRGVVVARGIDNSRDDAAAVGLLREEEEHIRGEGAAAAADPRLAAWIEAYRGFGADPARHPPSIAFLVRRIVQGKTIRSISPVVDLFNWISLKHLVPAGGDGVDDVTGDLTLGLAAGTELFSPLGMARAVEHPEPGELA
jgi:DNA/RNA-binding domain of Phe-tRNA-synthetase-like protein